MLKVLKDLFEYKELLYALVSRDISARYKQTILGIVWIFFKPIFSMVAMTIVFGKLANMPSDGIPYALITLSGITLWQFFSIAVMEAASGLVGNSNLITKVYFSRVVLVMAPILVSAVDFLVSLGLFFLLALFYGYFFSTKVIFFPVIIIILILIIFGLSLFLATLNLLFRDIKIVIPFILQLGIYISPVGYLTNLIPEKYLYLFYLNPLVGIIDAMRWCFFPSFGDFNWQAMAISLMWMFLLIFYGIKFFSKFEKKFADYI